MSWNGSGTFSPTATYYPEVNGTVIDAVRYNGLMLDLAGGINNALAKDGQNTATGNLKLGGYKITGLGAGTAAGDAVRWEQIATAGETAITASGTTVNLATVNTANIALAGGGVGVTSFGTVAAGRSYQVRITDTSFVLGSTITSTAAALPYGVSSIQMEPGMSFRLISLGSGSWVITDFLNPQAGRMPWYKPNAPTVSSGAGTGATVSGNAYAFTVTIGTSPSAFFAVTYGTGQKPLAPNGTGIVFAQSSRSGAIVAVDTISGNTSFNINFSPTPTAGDVIKVFWVDI